MVTVEVQKIHPVIWMKFHVPRQELATEGKAARLLVRFKVTGDEENVGDGCLLIEVYLYTALSVPNAYNLIKSICYFLKYAQNIDISIFLLRYFDILCILSIYR